MTEIKVCGIKKENDLLSNNKKVLDKNTRHSSGQEGNQKRG